MTGAEFARALRTIGWSKRQVVRAFRCDTNAPARWEQDREPVPAAVVAWLEPLVAAHLAHPTPYHWWRPRDHARAGPGKTADAPAAFGRALTAAMRRKGA